MTKDYQAFVSGKLQRQLATGIEGAVVSADKMFPFQADLTQWALRRGRAALFADTGLGKSRMTVTWAAAVAEHTGLPVLITTPLAVATQMAAEALNVGISARIVKDGAEVDAGRPGVYVCNLERLHRFDDVRFGGVAMSVHCMLMPTSKERDGYIGLRDFRGDLIRAFQGAGFIFHSEVSIWKDPVQAMQRTKALGLLHKTIRKDSSMSRQGINDYLVTMRKPGENELADRVSHTHESFPVALWQRYASPVWATLESPPDASSVRADLESVVDAVTGKAAAGLTADELLAKAVNMIRGRAAILEDSAFSTVNAREVDGDDTSGINASNTLQRKSARDENDERHIAPLQLSVIRRAIRLWSNPGDVVLSPFGGIGSEGYVALQEGRRALLVELKCSYFAQLVKNLAAVAPTPAAPVAVFPPPGWAPYPDAAAAAQGWYYELATGRPMIDADLRKVAA